MDEHSHLIETDLFVGRCEFREHICVQLLLLCIVFFNRLLAKGDLVKCCFVVWLKFANLFNTIFDISEFLISFNWQFVVKIPCWNLLKHYSDHLMPTNLSHGDNKPSHCSVRFPTLFHTKINLLYFITGFETNRNWIFALTAFFTSSELFNFSWHKAILRKTAAFIFCDSSSSAMVKILVFYDRLLWSAQLNISTHCNWTNMNCFSRTIWLPIGIFPVWGNRWPCLSPIWLVLGFPPVLISTIVAPFQSRTVWPCIQPLRLREC